MQDKRNEKLELKEAVSLAVEIINRQFQILAHMSGMKLNNYTDDKYENLISTYMREINVLINSLPDEEKEDCKKDFFTDIKGLEEWLRRVKK